MQLNLPILHLLENSQNILIAGAGGGFDVFAGIPLYFTLREMGKTVHLANYSFTDPTLADYFSTLITEIPEILVGVRGALKKDMYYYTEGYLSDWFAKRGEDPIIWMFPNLGVLQLKKAYEHLVRKFNIDAIILVDGGVDSLARGDEVAPGSMLEDSISLVAIEAIPVPVKILATIGFGTEVEEGVDHHTALENIAGISKAGGFYGTCSLVHTMPVFKYYDEACRHAWDGEQRALSHISTRIIPAAQGEFGDFRMYRSERTKVFISPLMSIYWFFDADVVAKRNLTADAIRNAEDKDETRRAMLMYVAMLKEKRPRRAIPY